MENEKEKFMEKLKGLVELGRKKKRTSAISARLFPSSSM